MRKESLFRNFCKNKNLQRNIDLGKLKHSIFYQSSLKFPLLFKYFFLYLLCFLKEGIFISGSKNLNETVNTMDFFAMFELFTEI